MKALRLFLVVLVCACATGCEPPPHREKSIMAEARPVRVVVVNMFEIGEDTGDRAGEFQLWKERRNLTEILPFHGYRDLHYDPESELLVMVTGIGTARAAAATMALGMDDRFDLSLSYWVIVGIAGIDPEDAPVGSAAWAEYLVDGDLSHQIDAREKPEDWPFGYFARYTKRPFDPNKPEPTGEMYQLNSGLVEWAYQLTKDMELPTDPTVLHESALYTEHPNAQGNPVVLKGDHIAALTFWHGAIMNDWANQWVDYWTEGKGNMVTSAMEDTGTYLSLSWLDRIGKVDKDRVLVLRTGSNYTMQPPGRGAAENLLKENQGYAGLQIAVEAGYQVGARVVDELLAGWDEFEAVIPTAQPMAED
jgi:purine nucleoside permease